MVGFPDLAVRVFSADEAVIAAGVSYALIVGMTQLFMAAEVVLMGAFAGAEWTVPPAAVEIGLTAARIPLAWFLVEAGWGIEAVWTAIAVTTVIKGALLGAMFGWKTRLSAIAE